MLRAPGTISGNRLFHRPQKARPCFVARCRFGKTASANSRPSWARKRWLLSTPCWPRYESMGEKGAQMKKLVFGAFIAIAANPAMAANIAVDNERVTAWNVPLAKGEAAPSTPSDMDSVTMFLGGGTVKTRHSDGSVT